MRSKMYFYDNPKVTVVQGVRLDDYLNDHDFDLVFMDIEGSEYFAFLGMQDIFAHAKALIVEFLPHHLIQVAGVTVEQFLAPLMPHFRSLTIPGMGRIAAIPSFACCRRWWNRNGESLPLSSRNSIGSSKTWALPGTGETPAAPVFIDGKKSVTLRGPTVAADFKKMVINSIEKRYGAASAGQRTAAE